MGKAKFSAGQIGEFRAILGLGWSLALTRQHFQAKGVDVTRQYLSLIRQG